MEELVQKLASIDELETWKQHCQGYSSQEKKTAFERAQSLWIARKVSENTLYLHPEVISDLQKQNWLPNDLQKRMIWASVLVSGEGSDSRQRFKSIKASLLKRHGRDWWEDVYNVKNLHLQLKNVFVIKRLQTVLLLICLWQKLTYSVILLETKYTVH
ncbi:hypothetical protein [Pseudoalteromonas nigrifaciens]|uniref:hypothetical protein n=1 Tax=Pseudoalteromonas nigrifaciens TaxID=28109 RepID=UPI003FD29535